MRLKIYFNPFWFSWLLQFKAIGCLSTLIDWLFHCISRFSSNRVFIVSLRCIWECTLCCVLQWEEILVVLVNFTKTMLPSTKLASEVSWSLCKMGLRPIFEKRDDFCVHLKFDISWISLSNQLLITKCCDNWKANYFSLTNLKRIFKGWPYCYWRYTLL